MKDKNSISEAFNELKCCVLIPTYNNDLTLNDVITSVKEYTNNIIVINDGSGDSTEKILEKIEDITVCSYTTNRGKGYALRTGFSKAYEMGYKFAISIDSDGQHYAEDLVKFIDQLSKNKNVLLIGGRNMHQDGIPSKSSFGNRFSNFWVKIVTGFKLNDTQSGYRLYPLETIEQSKFFTSKYEFEIEVLAKLAWHGTELKNIPIEVYYPNPEDRVTHFRPFKDFIRISLLNTYLVILTFLFYLPKRTILKYRKKNIKQIIRDDIFASRDSNSKIALAIAFGFFMGIVPVWGYQLIIGFSLAHIMKINKAIFFITANISIPPMIPIILFASYYMGGLWLGEDAINMTFSEKINLNDIFISLGQYIIGAFTLAIVMGFGSFGISYLLLRIFRKKI